MFVWLLGIPLVILDAAQDPYWQNVVVAGAAGFTGSTPPGSIGPWRTAGEVLALVLLAALADVSEGGATFAAWLLIGLWILFLLAHASRVGGFLGKFVPGPAASAGPLPGGGGGQKL